MFKKFLEQNNPIFSLWLLIVASHIEYMAGVYLDLINFLPILF